MVLNRLTEFTVIDKVDEVNCETKLMLHWTVQNHLFLSDTNAITPCSCEWEIESWRISTIHIFYINHLLCIFLVLQTLKSF